MAIVDYKISRENMSIKAKGTSRVNALILVIFACIAGYRWWQGKAEAAGSRPTSIVRPQGAHSPARMGAYEKLENCTLVESRGNDGDSFDVRLPDKRVVTLRLYFVDTPESAFKTYRGGANNYERIEQQARYFGITSDDAVKVGKDAKDFALRLLGQRPFTIETAWEDPFGDHRYHAFVQVVDQGRVKELHEMLVEKGYARIFTKGATTPAGVSSAEEKRRLQQIESLVRQQRLGAWGLRK